MTHRWELLRALGAVADSPAVARAVAGPLGLAPLTDAEHTDVFVLNCPPYASVYLGPDGALGGEGTDRAAGFWRAIAVSPPAEPDHLTALLALYASLGEAAAEARRPATRQAPHPVAAGTVRRTSVALAARLPGRRGRTGRPRPDRMGGACPSGHRGGVQRAAGLAAAAPGPTRRAGRHRRRSPPRRCADHAGPQRHHRDPAAPGRRRGGSRPGAPDRRAPLHPARHVRPGSAVHPGVGRARGDALAASPRQPGRRGRGGRLVGGSRRTHPDTPTGR